MSSRCCCGTSAKPMPKPRRPRWSKRSTSLHSTFAAARSLQAPPPASRSSGRTRKRVERWKKPTAPCMCARRSDCCLQFLQFHFQILVRHDQRLDGAAQVAIAHRDRLIAGLFVAAVVESGGRGKDNALSRAPNKVHGKAPDSKMGGGACSLFVLHKSREKEYRD